MSTNLNETRQTEGLAQDPGYFIKIYEEQLKHIRHLENSDDISLALIAIISLATLFVFHLHFIKEEPHIVLPLSLATIILLGGPGIYGTTRRMTYRMRHLVIINRASRAMGAVKAGVIPASMGPQIAGNFWAFWKRLFLGYRGPVIVFYSSLIWAIVFSSFFKMGFYIISWPMATFVALLIVIFCNLTSTLSSWFQFKQEMMTLKQEVELGTSTVKSLAEQNCDLADSLMALRPPRLNEALSHYEIALKLEPENPRARVGAEKLMSWKVQDYLYK